MYLIAIAWIYVVLMMAVAEATGTGTLLGAIFTFLLYGLLPLGIVLYIGGTPARRRARRRAEADQRSTVEAGAAGVAAAGQADPAASTPDGGGHAARHTVSPIREEP